MNTNVSCCPWGRCEFEVQLCSKAKKFLLELAVRKQLRDGALNRGAVVPCVCVQIHFWRQSWFCPCFFLSELKIGCVEMWEPDCRYWKSLCEQELGCSFSMDFAMHSSPPDPSSLNNAGLFLPSSEGETSSSPEHSRENHVRLVPGGAGSTGWVAVVVSQPELYCCLGRTISLSPLLPRCAFISTVRWLQLKGLGTWVTREMGTSWALIEHESSGISCPGAHVLLFCWNHWWLLWKSVRINSIARSFWPEQEFNNFLTTAGVKEKHLWNGSVESWEFLVGPQLTCSMSSRYGHHTLEGAWSIWGRQQGEKKSRFFRAAATRTRFVTNCRGCWALIRWKDLIKGPGGGWQGGTGIETAESCWKSRKCEIECDADCWESLEFICSSSK